MTNKRACVFCGGTPVSREHLIPSWVQTALKNNSREVEFGEHWQYYDGTLQRYFANKKRPSFVANHMCGGCNTGWMQTIEHDATPIVSALISGRAPTMISLDDQVKMAKWLGLKAVVERYISRPIQYIEPYWLTTFAQTHAPPTSWSILIGRHQGNAPFTLASRIGSRSVTAPNGAVTNENVLLTMMSAGDFAAQIIGATLAFPFPFDANRLVQIWPQPSSGRDRASRTGSPDIQWPPIACIDDEDLVTMREFPGGIG